MSSASRFAHFIDSAYKNNDLASMRDAYNQFQDVNCLYPQRLRILDSATQTYRYIMVPCGSCWHCQQTKINEWCTRMYAHAEDFKNVYFVTLTYRGFTNCSLSVNQLMLAKLGQAVWNLDNFNSTHHTCYSPSVLVKKHYQDFLKRLRKYSGINDLTYVCSGEYGHDYGRPHFHFIFFTNHELKREDVVRAWSIALWQKSNGCWSYRRNQKHNGSPYDFPIGHVDFHSLVTNGSFNTGLPIKVDGNFMNAANCFAYVCKYVVKRDRANLNRVRLAFNNLFHKQQYVNIGEDEVQVYMIKRYLSLAGIPYDLSVINQLKKFTYEKSIFQPSETISQHGLCRYRTVEKQNLTFRIDLLPEKYINFRDLYRPFCEFSRGTPIGSVYAKRNIQEFASGVFTKPILQRDGFVVPRYFRSKAQDYLYGLRRLSTKIKGTSFVKSGLVDLYRQFSDAVSSPSSLSYNLGDSFPYGLLPQALHDDYKVLINNYTKERIVCYNGYAQHYKYNRHIRNYEFIRAIPLPDFIRSCVTSIRDEIERADVRSRESKRTMQLNESSILKMSDCGIELNELKKSYLDRQNSIRIDLDKLYHSVHKSAE